jgi:hypothetical protein
MTDQLASEVFTAAWITIGIFIIASLLYIRQNDKKINQPQPESDRHLNFMEKRDAHLMKIRTK